MLTKSDRKHLELMKKSIHFFEEENLTLDSLVRITQSLEELFDELKQTNVSWKDSFREEWSALEITSADLMSVQEENEIEIDELSKEYSDFILTAIQNIKALIDQILKENPINDNDPSGEEVTRTTEFDKNQLQMMKQCLQSFEQANPNLDNLTKTSQSLKELLDSLESVNNKWKKAFNSEWWMLEFVFSITQDQKIHTLSHENKEKVLTASANMKKMINDVLATGKYVR